MKDGISTVKENVKVDDVFRTSKPQQRMARSNAQAAYTSNEKAGKNDVFYTANKQRRHKGMPRYFVPAAKKRKMNDIVVRQAATKISI